MQLLRIIHSSRNVLFTSQYLPHKLTKKSFQIYTNGRIQGSNEYKYKLIFGDDKRNKHCNWTHENIMAINYLLDNIYICYSNKLLLFQ